MQASKVKQVIDTTAAGDTFIGYYLAQIGKGMDDKEALKIASKASAICVAKAGAAVSIPFYSDIIGKND